MITNSRDQKVAVLAIEALKEFNPEVDTNTIQRVQKMGNVVDFCTKEYPQVYEDRLRIFLNVKKSKDGNYAFGKKFTKENEAKEVAKRLGVRVRKFKNNWDEDNWIVYTNPKDPNKVSVFDVFKIKDNWGETFWVFDTKPRE